MKAELNKRPVGNMLTWAAVLNSKSSWFRTKFEEIWVFWKTKHNKWTFIIELLVIHTTVLFFIWLYFCLIEILAPVVLEKETFKSCQDIFLILLLIISLCRRAWTYLYFWTLLNPLYQRILCTMFGSNWHCSGEVNKKNAKSLLSD